MNTNNANRRDIVDVSAADKGGNSLGRICNPTEQLISASSLFQRGLSGCLCQ